jgi:WD40 repeat protein
MDFSPDGTFLATSSDYGITKIWNTKTWQEQGKSIKHGFGVSCVRYSPSGDLLATATSSIEIYASDTRERVISFKGHKSHNFSLAWTPDGTRLLTGGDGDDPTIREWDTTTWQQVGDPWTGHSTYINVIVINRAGTLVASVCREGHVRLWRLSDRRTVAIFKHSFPPEWVTFSVDDKHILSGGDDRMVSKWAVPHNINSKACFHP